VEERTFWITLWSLVLMAICTIVVSLAIDSWHSDELWYKALEDGRDPITMECARSSGSSTLAPICSKVKDGR
jgi:hypothetical protein